MSYPRPTLLRCLLLLVSTALFASAEVKVGEPFPTLANRGLEGAVPDLAGRVVMVDFWATWCAPCKVSFPFYGALQTELGSRGFTLVAVSVDKTAKAYADFVKRLAPGFATVRDADQKLVAAVAPPAMPTCYLVDRKGTLRFVHAGFHGEDDVKRLRSEIALLLEEKP